VAGLWRVQDEAGALFAQAGDALKALVDRDPIGVLKAIDALNAMVTFTSSVLRAAGEDASANLSTFLSATSGRTRASSPRTLPTRTRTQSFATKMLVFSRVASTGRPIRSYFRLLACSRSTALQSSPSRRSAQKKAAIHRHGAATMISAEVTCLNCVTFDL